MAISYELGISQIWWSGYRRTGSTAPATTSPVLVQEEMEDTCGLHKGTGALSSPAAGADTPAPSGPGTPGDISGPGRAGASGDRPGARLCRNDISQVPRVRCAFLWRAAKGVRASGRHDIPFESRGLPSGVYFYRLKAGKRNDNAQDGAPALSHIVGALLQITD